MGIGKKRIRILQVVVAMLVLLFGTLPAMALLPAEEAERLLASATEKLDSNEFVEAGNDLAKIRALNTNLPPEYYYRNGQFLAGTRQAIEAKKNLQEYQDKAGKEGKYYQAALELFGTVEANEKRWARFKLNNDGTVTDTQTGLMWADKDNGDYVNWSEAKAYCQNYKAGGHTDWRLPTRDELAAIYDKEESNGHTPLIVMTTGWAWASDTRGNDAAAFYFPGGDKHWDAQSYSGYNRALPVRGGK